MKTLLAFLLLVVLSNLSYADDFAETLKLAEQGNASAQNNLGDMYNSGEGVPPLQLTGVCGVPTSTAIAVYLRPLRACM